MSTDRPKPSQRPRVIEFWFDFGSNYSYLSAMRIEREAERAGVAVDWRPFLLGPVFKNFGWSTSPFVLQQEKGRYVWLDMVRQCQKFGLPWRQPTTFPRQGVLPSRVAVAFATEPWIAEFCRAVMARNFADDRDIHRIDDIREALRGLVGDTDFIIATAGTEQARQSLRQQTERAVERGIFGAPTFFVGDEMFWGNDRLDDALAAASSMR